MVAFTLPSGDRVTFTALTVGREDYPIGKKVDVIYRMDLPSEAVIDRPRARWARNGLVAVGALGMMAFGAYFSWYARNDALRRGVRE